MWKKLKERMQGQSLVELTITLPVLILLFLGLIELGMALRAYLVLVNANREAARFAGRGVYTDEDIASRGLIALTDQLPYRTTGADANMTITITRFKIDKDASKAPTYEKPIYVTGTLTTTTKIDPDAYALYLKARTDEINTALESTAGAAASGQTIVLVEMFYYHRQVLHAPIVEWVFPEPMVLYARTEIREGSGRVSQ